MLMRSLQKERERRHAVARALERLQRQGLDRIRYDVFLGAELPESSAWLAAWRGYKRPGQSSEDYLDRVLSFGGIHMWRQGLYVDYRSLVHLFGIRGDPQLIVEDREVTLGYGIKGPVEHRIMLYALQYEGWQRREEFHKPLRAPDYLRVE